MERKNHWENIYQSKQLHEVSWYQPVPETSLQFLKLFNLPLNARIIDIGGGDSFLVDHLLKLGYQDITILDISESAINRAKIRLGNKSEKVKWIAADASTFSPSEKYDLWHDRAAFHFLTNEKEIEHYVETAGKSINPNGYLIMGTFSENGPKKCSGLDIRQYSEDSMNELFRNSFEKIECITVDHKTPFDIVQNFLFCCFRKKL